MIKYKGAAFTVLLLGITAMVYSGYRLNETMQIYSEGAAVYDGLSSQVRKASVPAGAVPAEQTGGEKAAPAAVIDFEALETINGDAAAWLYSPGTVIDYPVMKADDYSYYLTRLPDGTVNANGSLFIDYNNPSDFSGGLTVIYGHHMRSGSMFGSLMGYKNQEYYENHPAMHLYTEHADYRIELLYGFITAAGEWSAQSFMLEENTGSLLTYAAQNTTFVSRAAYEPGDRIVVLSTCSYEFDDARYAVVGVLREV
ncbi:MAG: class B sortase [Oscillospiraceae bacterium]|nr:class B sortase [Oscillospiraceae bacterium]